MDFINFIVDYIKLFASTRCGLFFIALCVCIFLVEFVFETLRRN